MAKLRNKLPSQQALNALFEFDPTSGLLRWKDNPNWTAQHRGRLSGKIAGGKKLNGHVQVKIDGRGYLAHRIIWKMVHGTEPLDVRHKAALDCNILASLRGRSQTGAVLPAGVHRAMRRGYFYATIHIGRKRLHLGTFSTVEEAIAAQVSVSNS